MARPSGELQVYGKLSIAVIEDKLIGQSISGDESGGGSIGKYG